MQVLSDGEEEQGSQACESDKMTFKLDPSFENIIYFKINFLVKKEMRDARVADLKCLLISINKTK